MTKSNKKKKTLNKNYLLLPLEGYWREKQDPELDPDPHPNLDPALSVRGTGTDSDPH
jgi:hypothetical protein